MSSSVQATAGERADLLETLAKHRYFLRHTVRGLTDEQAARHTTASELCLGGLIKHVALTERQWIKFIRQGPSAMSPAGAWGGTAGSLGWRLPEQPGDTLAGLLDDYEETARRTDELVAALPDWTSPIRCRKLPGSSPERAGRRAGCCST